MAFLECFHLPPNFEMVLLSISNFGGYNLVLRYTFLAFTAEERKFVILWNAET